MTNRASTTPLLLIALLMGGLGIRLTAEDVTFFV